MIILLFLLLSTSSNTFYLMDESFTLFPTNEEILFNSSRRVIRIIQGFPDNGELRYRYEAKFEIPLFSELSLYYRFHKEKYFDLDEELHRFELNWIPRTGDFFLLTYSFVIAPAYKNNSIDIDLLGLGFGFWKNLSNNHSIYIILEDFYNKGRYSNLPLRLELEGRLRNKWASLYYYYRYTQSIKKEFNLYDAFAEVEERRGKTLLMSSNYQFMNNLLLGLRLRYLEWGRDSTYIMFGLEEDFQWDWEYLFTEPYVETRLFDRDNLHIGLPMAYRKEPNELEYERKWIGIKFHYNYRIHEWLNFPFSIQKSWGRLNGEASKEIWGVLGIEYRYKKKTYIAFRGIVDLEWLLTDILQSPHNHAYVMLSHRF